MKISKVIHYIVLTLLLLISIIPFIVLIHLAFKISNGSNKEVWSFTNFVQVVEKFDIGTAFMNSALITLGAIVVLIVFASMAGYTIARNKIVTNKAIYMLFLFSMMIPAIINSVPLYKVMQAIGGINSRWAMSLLLATNAMPFSTFLYAGYMTNIPVELEEAAKADGAGVFRVFWKIVFPLLKPVTMSIIIINGIGIWNNYAQAVFYLQDKKVQTIPLAMQLFFQQYGAQWHLMASATLIAMIPAVVTFIVGQKYFMEGLASGSVKG